MALSEASGLALARKRNMSKIDFYHVNYENLAENANLLPRQTSVPTGYLVRSFDGCLGR
jgi:hypothetical protein